ncbi:MAG: inositol monophosphatase [Alphaproteobacteria bacterium]
MVLVRSANMNIMMKAAQAAGRSLIRDFNEVEKLQISRKGPADFVSQADQKAESIIHTQLKKARPDYDFLMEESGKIRATANQKSDYCFIIDPLDGTTNFIHGLGHFAVSIGLAFKDEIIAGCVYDPIKDEHFWAEKDKGAFLGSMRLRVAERRQLKESIFATGIPFLGRAQDNNGHQHYLNHLGHFMATTAGIRRFGAAALDLCYVAAGRFDGYWESNLSDWDIAAGIIIAKEAGATLTNLQGNGWQLGCDHLLCANSVIHPKALSLLQK